MIYINGIKINISDVARIIFTEGFDGDNKVVCQVAMQLEVLKALRDGITTTIDQHDAKLANLKKAN